MITRRGLTPLLGAVALAPTGAGAKPPKGYPRSYAGVIEGAKSEGRLVVYGTTDTSEITSTLNDFASLYPRVRMQYVDMKSADIYQRVIRETESRRPSADLVWSSAMDWQVKLINDGYAQPYASPEKPNLPAWAVWKNEGWGVTAEPIVFAYNRRLMPAGDVPQNHSAFERLLREKSQAYRGKVATYDPVRSGVGFLYLSQDMNVSRDTWKFVRALGGVDPRFYASSGEMIEALISGRQVIAYNMIGSYAFERAKTNPALGIVYPSDYTQVMSRIAFIAREARNPNAAKLFLDYLLSARGQMQLARRSMGPVRTDLRVPGILPLSADRVQAIRVGPGLLANIDQATRARFLRTWDQSLRERR